MCRHLSKPKGLVRESYKYRWGWEVHIETRTIPGSFEIQSGVLGSGEGEDCRGSFQRKLLFSVTIGKPSQYSSSLWVGSLLGLCWIKTVFLKVIAGHWVREFHKWALMAGIVLSVISRFVCLRQDLAMYHRLVWNSCILGWSRINYFSASSSWVLVLFVNAANDGSKFYGPIPLASNPYFHVAAPCFDGFLMKVDSWFCLVMCGRSRSLEGAGAW